MQRRSKPPRHDLGFTLAELAIVMIVIALLVALALKLGDMVTQARVKKVINDLTGVEAAAALYRDRYRALPGDDAQAAGRWPATKNGTGNSIISGRFNDPAPADLAGLTVNDTAGESIAFWWHLRLSGLIHGPSSGLDAAKPPMVSTGGIMGVEATALSLGGPVACIADVPHDVAIALDAQLDDDNPSSGYVRAVVVSAGRDTLCKTMRSISTGSVTAGPASPAAPLGASV